MTIFSKKKLLQASPVSPHPGLQVQNLSGEWIDAPPIPNTFVINIGKSTSSVTSHHEISHLLSLFVQYLLVIRNRDLGGPSDCVLKLEDYFLKLSVSFLKLPAINTKFSRKGTESSRKKGESGIIINRFTA